MSSEDDTKKGPRPVYVAPQVIRLDHVYTGAGANCPGGSNPSSGNCSPTGNGASQGNCYPNGNGAKTSIP